MNWEVILKYINQEADRAETDEVNTWLNQQAAHRHLLDYLQKRQADLQQPLKKDDIHEQWVLLLDRILETKTITGKLRQTGGFWMLGIAASLLLVSSLGWVYWKSFKNAKNDQAVVVSTPGNRRGYVMLPDSSEVFMAPNSKLTYNTGYGVNKRELHLTGEAFFNVKHKVQKPFTVYTENHLAVTVLGTSFNIYARKAAATEVKVASGKVGVVASGSTHFLIAGQQLVYQQNGKLLLKAVEHNDAASLQSQTLYFKNNNADEVAERLHRWYNINVEVLPAAHEHTLFSGEMKDEGITNVMKGLQYATGIKYHYKNANTIVLY